MSALASAVARSFSRHSLLLSVTGVVGALLGAWVGGAIYMRWAEPTYACPDSLPGGMLCPLPIVNMSPPLWVLVAGALVGASMAMSLTGLALGWFYRRRSGQPPSYEASAPPSQ